MLFDIHGDIWTDVTIKRELGRKNIIRNEHLNRFNEGGLIGGIFVIWADPPYDKNPKKRLIDSIKAMSCELWKSRDILKVIYDSDDFYEALNGNRLAVILGLEGLSSIEDDIDSIYTLYQLGFRHVSLTWNEQNSLATGVKGDENRGLTQNGKNIIKIINELGMILDVSHINEKSFWDIVNETEYPFIASHSNAKALCDVPRNLSDDQIKAIGEKKGLIGLNAFNEFISLEPDKKTVDYFINHIEHIVNLIGMDFVAFGFDFFDYLKSDTTESFTNGGFNETQGLENITKGKHLLKKLKDRGFSEADISKISYINFLNLMDRVLRK